jgi:hypothetical protein
MQGRMVAARRVETEGQEMNNWRLAASAILGAAVVVSCIVYVVSPVPPQRVEADQRLPPVLPSVTGHDTALSTNIQHPIAEDRITAFERAAEAILRRAQNARASADEPPLIAGHVPLPKGHVPLPKKRPIPRL